MSDTSASFVGRTTGASVLVRAARRVASGSLVWAVSTVVRQRLRRTRARIVVGLGGEWSPQRERHMSEHVATLVKGSRVVSALASLLTAPLAALPDASSTRVLAPVLRLDLQARVRVAAYVLVIAVLTHALLLGLLGVRVQVIGWGIRIGVATAGLLVVWRPRAMAAAIRDRTAR